MSFITVTMHQKRNRFWVTSSVVHNHPDQSTQRTNERMENRETLSYQLCGLVFTASITHHPSDLECLAFTSSHWGNFEHVIPTTYHSSNLEYLTFIINYLSDLGHIISITYHLCALDSWTLPHHIFVTFNL